MDRGLDLVTWTIADWPETAPAVAEHARPVPVFKAV